MRLSIVLIWSFMLLTACKNDQNSETDTATTTTESSSQKTVADILGPKLTTLQGNWRSADDPKLLISITMQDYVTIYDGKIVSTQTIEMFEVCPEFCKTGSDVSGMACFVLKGESDATCYGIIQLEGKTLKCTIMGGDGKTLTYTKLGE